MLLPKSVQEYMGELGFTFNQAYSSIMAKMTKVMIERGEVRDKDTPIYLRRSPEENLGIAHGKVYRVESLLHQLSASKDPYGEGSTGLLHKIIEECVDIANYVIFIAALCQVILAELED